MKNKRKEQIKKNKNKLNKIDYGFSLKAIILTINSFLIYILIIIDNIISIINVFLSFVI